MVAVLVVGGVVVGVVVVVVVLVLVWVELVVVEVVGGVDFVVWVACVTGQTWAASWFSVLAPWLRLLRRLSATPPRFCTDCEKFAAADWASVH